MEYFQKILKLLRFFPSSKYGDIHHYALYTSKSILLQYFKIIEKVFDKRLGKFVDKYNLLDESKYGFRIGRSTAMALMDWIEGTKMSLDDK